MRMVLGAILAWGAGRRVVLSVSAETRSWAARLASTLTAFSPFKKLPYELDRSRCKPTAARIWTLRVWAEMTI